MFILTNSISVVQKLRNDKIHKFNRKDYLFSFVFCTVFRAQNHPRMYVIVSVHKYKPLVEAIRMNSNINIIAVPRILVFFPYCNYKFSR